MGLKTLAPVAPKLHLDFDELVFHGFAPEQARAVATHLEHELSRLAQAHFASHPGWSDTTMPAAVDLAALNIHANAVNPLAPPVDTARNLANHLWRSLAPALAPKVAETLPAGKSSTSTPTVTTVRSESQASTARSVSPTEARS
jgi:hypothetical protein